MARETFKTWFEKEGDLLLRCWFRAREDGNEEPFTQWALGEYDTYLRDKRKVDGYEVPYGNNRKALFEELIFGEFKMNGHKVQVAEGRDPEYPCIFVVIEGYGDRTSKYGYGSPLMLEFAEGRLRAIVNPDINAEEPVIVDLEGARESARED